MTLRYRYYEGGDYNPFRKERDKAYSRLTEERVLVDPYRERPTEEIFPRLDGWPDYVIAESRNTFWEMERNVAKSGEDAADRVEALWREEIGSGGIGEWLKKVEADETEKALALYMASMYRQFNPEDNTVDFRLYFTESLKGHSLEATEPFNINPYEG